MSLASLSVIGNRRGSVLVALIITMVIIASLGAALITMSNTSSLSQFGAMDSFRAYYLAEAGGRYAIPIIKKNISDPATLDTLLNNKTFTLANNDAFQLSLSYTAPVYTLVSKGILAQGSQALNATRSVIYTITATAPGSSEIKFDTAADLTSNWTGFAPNKTAVVNNQKSDNSPALNVAGKDVSIKLAWDGSATLPNLADVWSDNGELLSYELQVKVKTEDVDEYMTGISFRERSNSRYGLSFMKRNNCSKSLPSNVFCSQVAGSDSNIYVVLWKNVSGTYTVLRYHKIVAADNILLSGVLKDWSTLVLKLEEQYVLDGSGNKVDGNGDGFYDRKNLITAYVQGTAVYPRGTMGWDYSKFKLVTWDTGTASPVVDTSLTSEDFANRRPSEIGLHTYYTNAGNFKQFFDDFAITLGSGSGGSSSVIQY